MQELCRYGVRLDLHRGGASVAAYAPASGPGGMGMTLPLVRRARDRGVEIRDRVLVTRLHPDDTGISGVEYVDLISGEVWHLLAGAVVMAISHLVHPAEHAQPQGFGSMPFKPRTWLWWRSW